ncbi:hypothetical protein FACS189428_4060 [Clostridia bacterium]|nr:hypothetical protein FACS189428_4060 [Clostridia bacterium]
MTEKNSAGHKILTIVFTAVMLLGLTQTALAADADNFYALQLAAANGGTVRLTGDISIGYANLHTVGSETAGLIIERDLVLDLNGKTLSIDLTDGDCNGIKLMSGVTFTVRDGGSGGSLNITLNMPAGDVTSFGTRAGINTTDGTLIIDGGNVTVSGNRSIYGAAIGGGSGNTFINGVMAFDAARSHGGNIIINGGNINVSSAGWGAVIGGGFYDNGYLDNGGGSGNCGTIIINGGHVNATSTNSETAAIGGASKSVGGTITISGGVVEAKVGNSSYGAGIGGGSYGKVDMILITGGRVTAAGGDGAGIGDGTSYSGTVVTINGGVVEATSNRGYGIGAGRGNNNTKVFISGNAVAFASSIRTGSTLSGGVIFKGNDGAVYGDNITPTADFTIPAGKTLAIGAGQTLTIPNGNTLTNNGTINNSGTFNQFGTITGSGTVNHLVQFSTGAGGSITADAGGAAVASGSFVQQGKNVVFTANPPSTYGVQRWTDNGAEVNGATAMYTIASIAAVHNVTMEFAGIKLSGEGTQASPWLITTAAELDVVRHYRDIANPVQYFKLANNIDLTDYLSGYAKWGASGWMPIGNNSSPFIDNFDGAGYEVTGLWIDRTSSSYIGLFGYTGNTAVIKNLGVKTEETKGVAGDAEVGGLVGYHNGGSIENCYVVGKITGQGNNVGGLAGRNAAGTITGCFTAGSVESVGAQVGGITGQQAGTISNCYSTASAKGSGTVGGLVGWLTASGNLSSSYAAGHVTASATVGGAVGSRNNSATVANCYFDTQATEQANATGAGNSTGITGLTTAQMTADGVLTGELSALGTSDWTKRANDADGSNDYSYYPELNVFYGGTAAQKAASKLSVTNAVYSPAQDNADISAAKTLVQNAAYTTTQAAAANEEAALAKINEIIGNLALNGVTTTVTKVSYTAPVAGTADNPDGTDGNYTFTVKLNKGGGTEQTTTTLTLTITATAAGASNITATAGYGGVISAGANDTYTVTPTVAGYVIDQVFVDGVAQTVTDRATFVHTFPNDGLPHSIFATFGYTVNFNLPANGSLSVSSAEGDLSSKTLVRGGQALDILATPNASHNLTGFTINGTDLLPSYSSGYTFTIGDNGSYRTAGSTKFLTQGADITAAFSATLMITVTTGDNDGAGSLRQAIADIADGGTINFAPALAGQTIALTTAGLEIAKSVTIAGNGVTLDGSGIAPGADSQILRVGAGKTVTLSGLHFRNGTAENGGAAIRNGGGTLNLESCIFSGNQTTNTNSDGGAIYSTGGTAALNVRGCTFYNNSASAGGAICSYSGAVTLTGNIFFGNTASNRGNVVHNYTNSTCTSGGYNVSDKATGTDNTLGSGFTFVTGDMQETTLPFNTTTFAPALASVQIVPAGVADFPTTDFNGVTRTFPNGAAGAVEQDNADITPPALTAGTVSRTSDTAATVNFTSDEAGTYYYAVVADDAGDPNIDTSGAGTACGTTEVTIPLTTLTAGAKDIWIYVKDAAGNVGKLKIDIPAASGPGVNDNFSVSNNTTKYATLAEAAAAVENGGTITMLEKVTVSTAITLSEDKTYTIDFDNKMLESTSFGALLISDGTVTVKNGNLTGAIGVFGGELIVESGSYSGDYYAIACQTGKVTIISGSFTSTDNQYACLMEDGAGEIVLATGSTADVNPWKNEAGVTAVVVTTAAPTYGVSIGTLSNGTVVLDNGTNHADYAAGETVTLTIAPETGYELDGDISAYKTGDTGTAVTLSGTGNSRTFTMPDYGVTVTATFKPFADQTDILDAKAAIEGMTNVTVAQATANTEAAVKTWLATQINALAAFSSKGITVLASNITMNGFTAAIEGNSGNHTGTPGGFLFTVSLQKGNSATVTTASNSGTITATVFIPTPSAGDLSYGIPNGHVYNGTAQGIGTVSGATGMGAVTVYYTGTGYAKNMVAPANAGTYDVTADITAGTNYTAATGVSLGNYTIGKATANGVPKEVPVPVNFAQNVDVTLADLLPALSGSMSFGTIAYTLGTVGNTEGVLGTVSYTTGNSLTLPVQSVSAADKTATVNITVSSDNYTDFTATITVKTVATTALSVTGLTVKTKTYDGNTAATLEGTATLSGVQAGHNVTLSGTPSATFGDANAGTNKPVTISGLTLTGADRGWYHLDLSGFTGEISQKALANSMIAAISSVPYNGTAQTPALTVTDGALGTLVLNTDYENAAYSNNTNAGTASVSITGKGNYTGTASANFSIGKAAITATSATLAAKTYDGTTAGTASGVTFTGLQNGETLTLGTDFTASAAYNTADAGTNRGATVTVTLSNTVKADNYQLATSGNVVSLSNQTIGKATTSGISQTQGVEKNHAQNVDFDLTTLWTQPASPKTLGTVTYSPVITANTDGVLGTLSYTSGNTLALPVQSISTAGKTATVTVTVGSTNYADFTATITVETEDTQDDADIATVKSLVEGENYTTTQVNAPTQAAAKTVVENIIGTLNLNGVTATVNDGTFTAATAGTPSNKNGTNGSYTFTVTLSKGYGTPQTTVTLTLAITATPYDASQDNLDITAAKAAIESASYTDTQANIPDIAAAKTKVANIIGGLSLNGVTPTVIDGAFNPATAGTPSNMNGTNGSYTFTVKLNKGGGTEQTTIQLTLTVTATPYDATQDNLDISAAKALVENAGYTDTQANIPDATAAKVKVEAIIAGLSLNGVTATVAGGTFAPAIAGTATNLSGTNGSYTFTVNLNKGGGTQQTTIQLTLAVTATPYDPTQDNADISAAKALVETAGYTDTQANVPNAAAAETKVKAVINGLALNGVTTTVVPGAFTPAIAGTVSSLSGTNGSYTFTVNLNKGGGTEQTTIQLTLTVTATPYDATQDNLDITAAKALVENATYTDTQVNIPDAEAAKAKVQALIDLLNLNGVTPTVISGTFTPAIAGTVSNLSGTNGSYKFTVNLNKGAGTQQTTVQLTLNITATPYDATQDNADIAAAKAAIEGAAYTDTQANVPDAEAATAAVKAIFSTLNLNGVTATVVPGSFTAATAGNAGNPQGTNGSYTFTVNLNKGGGTQQTTISLTLTVTATPYTPPNTYLVNVSVTTNGTVTKDKSSATAGETITLTISPATGYELNTITAHKDGDATTTVTLNGTGNTRTFTMPTYNVTVNATFKKTADQLAVEAAKTAIESMNNVIVAQATANTEAAVKSWLVTQINALAGMNATGVPV